MKTLAIAFFATWFALLAIMNIVETVMVIKARHTDNVERETRWRLRSIESLATMAVLGTVLAWLTR